MLDSSCQREPSKLRSQFRFTQLGFGNLSVHFAVLEQLLVCALPHNLALVKHHDAIGVHDRTDALGHDELGGILGFLGERVSHRTVGFEVERRERVIENQDFRMTVDGAGDGQTLLLATGHVRAALCDRRIESAVHAVDEFAGLGHVGSGLDTAHLFVCQLAVVGGIGGQLKRLTLTAGGSGGIREFDRVVLSGLVAVADVAGHGALEQYGALRHVADLVA